MKKFLVTPIDNVAQAFVLEAHNHDDARFLARVKLPTEAFRVQEMISHQPHLQGRESR